MSMIDRGKLEGLRTRLIRTAQGRVLEVGAGEGANFGSFRPGIDWVGLEPDARRREVLGDKARRAGYEHAPLDARAERIPLPDHDGDVILATFVLCSVDDQAAAAREFRRVLRPDGRLLLVEHVAAPRGTGRRVLQRVVTPLSRRLDHGCRWISDPLPALEAAGFVAEKLDRYEVANGIGPRTPMIVYDGRVV